MRQPIRVLCIVLFAVATLLPGQAPARPPFDAHATMQAVAQLLERGHVSGEPLDREISERAFAGLLHALDPLGLYFLQSDVDTLAKAKDELGQDLKAGDDTFAMRLQDLYAQRVAEAIEHGLAWLGKPHDFTVDETMAIDVGPDGYARNGAELDDRWRRRIKYDLLVLEGDGVTGAAAIDRLRARYEHMAERTLLRRPEDVDAAFVEAIANSFDPHTSYMAPRVAENFSIQMRLNYEGIGALLSDEDGRVVISQLMPGGAALLSGQLHAGDVILGVAQGEDGPLKTVVGLDLDDVVDMIRGPRDTTVRLQVTTGATPPRPVVLVRRRTELTNSEASGKVIEHDGAKVGWIDLPAFYGDPRGHQSAAADVRKILDDFRAQGVGSVVLDLRRNGGGLLTEAVSLTGLFLDVGNVVQVRGFGGKVERLDDDEPGAAWTGPLVVLTSRFSASASEIVAGAIVDQGRGIVVGDTQTHGKGTVQTLIDLARRASRSGRPGPDGEGPSGTLKLTVQQFFRPGGASTQLRGVASDVVLPSWSESVAEGEGALPHALPFSHIDPVAGAPSAARDPALIARLAAESAARCAKEPQFQRVLAEGARRAQWLQRKVVPL
ncbi:MAG TPA: carboxy terminal-processing peptidase, partial [Planctomycetota bacterium]|nr:carboxy terminal-processing peptidase [Planctomycetota bacterium]